MFKELRRVDRKISLADIAELLNKCDYGVLSTMGEDGYPYGVPISYIYMNGAIYFHSATEGHKLENINYHKKGSFCVVGNTEILADKFTTNYVSAIAFGVLKEVAEEEKEQALLGFLEKYSSAHMEKGKAYIASSAHQTKVIKLSIKHVSGKSRK